MASFFNSLGLFNSGPHRFGHRAIGELVVPNAALNPVVPGSIAAGPLELVVVVSGRLVASSESALWTLRDAVAAQLTDPPVTATLVDHHGRTWNDMSFVRFEPLEPGGGGRRDRRRSHRSRPRALARLPRDVRQVPVMEMRG